MQELKQLRSQEDVAHWLARVLNRFTDLVFDEAAIPESPEDIANSIKEKENRKVTIIASIFIELISFSIWLPCLNDLFNIMSLAENVKHIMFAVATALILLATAIAIVFNLKQKT